MMLSFFQTETRRENSASLDEDFWSDDAWSSGQALWLVYATENLYVIIVHYSNTTILQNLQCKGPVLRFDIYKISDMIIKEKSYEKPLNTLSCSVTKDILKKLS